MYTAKKDNDNSKIDQGAARNNSYFWPFSDTKILWVIEMTAV